MIKVLIYSVSSVVVLFLLTKLMGEKQISQMNMFDYITGITIGSIAAEMSTNVDKNPFTGIIAMSVYATLSLTIAFLTQKSLLMRKILAGMPIILMRNGQMNKKAFKRSRIDINEFLMLSRIAGYYNIGDIDTAVMEENGTISFLPIEKKRPTTVQDLNLNPKQSEICVPVILDGKISIRGLKSLNKGEKWLVKEIKAKGYKNIKEIFLAVSDSSSEITVFT